MESSGFIRGNEERKEVELMDVLPPDLRAFSSQAQQQEFAKEYEKRNGVMVRLPWETPEAREARRKTFTLAPVTQLVGDPLRIAKMLQRVVYQIETLTPDREDYAKELARLAAEANKYEEALGRKPKDYTKGVMPKPKDEKPSTELEQKFTAYTALSERKRKESAEATQDVEFLKLIRDRESVAAVVEVATIKLVKLGVAA